LFEFAFSGLQHLNCLACFQLHHSKKEKGRRFFARGPLKKSVLR
jgi:hypothetical protein